MGENWLPHDNAVIPAGFAPDFGTPAYEGESIIDFHPPTRIPDHPFKVNRYYSKREGKHIIRIREGRFYLTTNVTKAVQAGSGGTTYDFMAVNGDDGFPSFANDSAAGVTAPEGALPKEFSDSDMAGYAFMDYPDVTDEAYVYVRYILKHDTNVRVGFAGITNDLNIVAVKDSSRGHATSGAKIYPISAATVEDDADDATVQHIMRANPSPAVPASLNDLAITGDRERYGVYYILLAKIEKIGSATGPIVTQFVHENITLSITTLATTDNKTGFGEA
jgi:hypothetical protein